MLDAMTMNKDSLQFLTLEERAIDWVGMQGINHDRCYEENPQKATRQQSRYIQSNQGA